MYSLRRAAVRLASSTSRSLLSTPRVTRSISTRVILPRSQPISACLFQRRFLADEATKEESENVAEEVTAASEIEVGEPIASDAAASEVEVKDAAEESIAADAAAETGAAEQIDVAAAGGSRQPAYDNWPGKETQPDGQNKIIYVGNLFFEVNEQMLEDKFAQIGTVNRVKVAKDPRGMSKGFGFIEFSTPEEAQKAIETFNQTNLEGRRLAIQLHRPRVVIRSTREQADPSSTLYVGNMSFEMTDRDLNSLFRPLRGVVDVRVAIDRMTGQPRGFAHADFRDVESATKAKLILADKELYGRKLRVDFGTSNRNQSALRSAGKDINTSSSALDS